MVFTQNAESLIIDDQASLSAETLWAIGDAVAATRADMWEGQGGYDVASITQLDAVTEVARPE